MPGFTFARGGAWEAAVVRYEITHKLAEGGMAELYLARELGAELFEKRVVIKRILPELASDAGFVAMLTNEARILARLNHPNIIQVYELGQQQDDLYMVLEFVEGADLRRILQRFAELGRLVPRGFACRVVADVLAGLQQAHALCDASGTPLGLVHRDVSPPNIMVSDEGGVKLLDFGIAKTNLLVTQAGQIKGKFAYMSPEQVQMQPLDGRSDLFAAGAILWEMLAGRVLWRRTNVEETIRAILKDPIPSLRAADVSIPEQLDAIVGRALARHPDARYPSAEAMRAALEDLMREERWEADGLSLRRIMRELFGGRPPPQGNNLTDGSTLILLRRSVNQAGSLLEMDPVLRTETATRVELDARGFRPEDKTQLIHAGPTVLTRSPETTPVPHFEKTAIARARSGTRTAPVLRVRRRMLMMMGVGALLFVLSLFFTYLLVAPSRSW